MSEQQRTVSARRRLRLWAELILLFVGGPVLLLFNPWVLADGRLFLFLWVIAGLCLAYLFRDRGFERSRLWVAKSAALPPSLEGGAEEGRGETCADGERDEARHPPLTPPSREGDQRDTIVWPRTWYFFDRFGWIAFRWVLIGTIIVFLYGLFAGQKVFGLRVPVEMFGLPRRMTGLFFMIALLYPWVSVYPQNVIYRAFFCRRYEAILGRGWAMILTSAVLFSFGHVMFGNWIVLALTFAGGVLFTRTYLKTRSLLLSVAEHALYGLLCFAIGVGIYLLYGAFD